MATFMTKLMSERVRIFILQTLRGVLRKEVRGYFRVFPPITRTRRTSLAMSRTFARRTLTVSQANVAQSQGEERAVHVAA